MAVTILKTEGLTKYIGNKAILDNVNMNIRQGDIYGLIGKNGAGKTTLIRLIASLMKPTFGNVELFGSHSVAGFDKARERIGCIVESPALFPNLTAVQNLEYYCKLFGIPNQMVISHALQTVGLIGVGTKKFKNYSLGMKQRLGLALALLNRPEFILLDEPINGLDPIGIMEMREILLKLSAEGITILISSHILSELSQMATRYGIIDNGKLIKEITHAELQAECTNSLCLKVENTAKAAYVLETALDTTNYKVVDEHEIRLYDYVNDPAEVNKELVQGGVRVHEFYEVGVNLEDYFRAVIGEGGVKYA